MGGCAGVNQKQEGVTSQILPKKKKGEDSSLLSNVKSVGADVKEINVYPINQNLRIKINELENQAAGGEGKPPVKVELVPTKQLAKINLVQDKLSAKDPSLKKEEIDKSSKNESKSQTAFFPEPEDFEKLELQAKSMQSGGKKKDGQHSDPQQTENVIDSKYEIKAGKKFQENINKSMGLPLQNSSIHQSDSIIHFPVDLKKVEHASDHLIQTQGHKSENAQILKSNLEVISADKEIKQGKNNPDYSINTSLQVSQQNKGSSFETINGKDSKIQSSRMGQNSNLVGSGNRSEKMSMISGIRMKSKEYDKPIESFHLPLRMEDEAFNANIFISGIRPMNPNSRILTAEGCDQELIFS